MSALTPDRFAEFYRAVHEYDPFPWQNRVAARACNPARGWPEVIALPTAAGKTACIDIALYALACQSNLDKRTAARRIFFVVDRRVVVDQAFLHAEQLCKRLKEAKEGIVHEVAVALRRIADGDRAVDVYALRGGMYREDVWVRNPLQPTVIASTVDQVGSRLLFRGYGVSDSMKPIHAGLVGNDVLILLDEAHCAKPFAETVAAVSRYRAWHEELAPFKFVTMTATPSTDLLPEQIERAKPEDLNHSVLGPRIKASKPTRLVVADKAKGKKGRAELVKVLAKEARELMGQPFGSGAAGREPAPRPLGRDGGLFDAIHEPADDGAQKVLGVGAIVNRVATARELRTELEKTGHKVILLTGRMRPLDRDRVLEDLRPLFSGEAGPKDPTFVVATQCLEVGADLDFHALVTECASLDALRQRFGRLNRVAKRPSAKAVVVVRGDETDDTSDDPVYGVSLANTWQWLKSKQQDGVFDFGVAAVNALVEALSRDELAALNAPASSGPVLLPAHLDCWVQTAPAPKPDPDPSVFLHGPKQSAVPDVQVVLRSDLGDDPRLWAEVVTLCPPSSSEALPVRLDVFRQWLAGEDAADESSDIEGDATERPPPAQQPTRLRAALCWQGPADDETKIVPDASAVQPNRTYVISLAADRIDFLGDFPSSPPADYAEEAFQRSRDRAVIRLPDVELDADADDFEDQLTDILQSRVAADSPPWLQRAVEDLSTGPKSRTAARYPAPLRGVVVTGKGRLHQFDPTFDDQESSESPTQVRVTLDAHTSNVMAFAERFSRGCGLSAFAEQFVLAARWHDVGKADPRFQAMLLGCSPRTTRPPLLAKSGLAFQTRREREAARVVHQFPAGGRHEMISLAAAAHRTDDDLILHLIASHHGQARPFASEIGPSAGAYPDFNRELLGESVNIQPGSINPEVANRTVPQRFWKMVRERGWWGSAFLEAVFRLADHAASQAEQDDSGLAGAPTVTPVVVRTAVRRERRFSSLVLAGLDGSNPLAFLAAVGVASVADRIFPETRLRWVRNGRWQPVLETAEEIAPDEFAERAATRLKALQGHAAFTLGELNADNLIASVAAYGQFSRSAAEQSKTDRTLADYCAAFGSDAVGTDLNPDLIQDTAFRTMSGAGHQHFLAFFRNIIASTGAEHLKKALFAEWCYDDPLTNLTTRWDPQDDIRYALRWKNPSSENTLRNRSGSVLGANRLAIEGLRLFPSVPAKSKLLTTGFRGSKSADTFFSWPIWEISFPLDVIRSLLALEELQQDAPNVNKLRAVGVAEVFRAQRITQGKYRNFSPASAV